MTTTDPLTTVATPCPTCAVDLTELFRGYSQQDAHEFLNYLLNEVAETLIKEQKLLKHQKEQEQGKIAAANGAPTPDEADGPFSPIEAQPPEPPLATRPPPTWIHALFEGVLTNETKCLCCETVRSIGCQVG